MNTFKFGDQTLVSNINFKELPRQSGAAFSSAIHIELHAPSEPASQHWLHEWKEADDTVTLSIALHHSGFLLRFTELCDFILDTAQRCISVLPHEQLDDHTIEHLLVDQVLPRFLAHEGHLLLHASAINVQGRTVLFLGKSGWGKSTLAALFHQAGNQLYSDDCVQLKHEQTAWFALPTYPSLRLLEDSIENNFPDDYLSSPVSDYSDKQRIALPSKPEIKAPAIHAMYFLSDPKTTYTQTEIGTMRPGAVCIELIERSFRLDLSNRDQSKQLMKIAAELTQSIPAYRLSYPHDFDNNSRLLATLIQHIQQ